ncbi:MAG: hypothetical protein A2Y58_01875 [Chloroflexi bacterium RBG_13_51_52]|nr:MAG: hypothetical protein A2Y58_01875 [Chloroflexi bacterium RBG_13_51_52]
MVRYQEWAGWPFRRIDENLSILDVVKFGTIDYKLAGLLWLLMEHRASVLVAAGPVWAGKTTLLHALLDFLPPEIEQVSLRGYEEDFKSLGTEKPENTYLITEEISNHSYEYLWGYQVVKAFEMLSKGYALGGTTHARNIREAAYILNALGVPLPLIASLGAIITLQVTRGKYRDEEPVRYVDSVSTISLTKDGLVAYTLASRHLPGEEFVYPGEQALHNVLFNKFAIKYDSITSEIESRGRFLSKLREKGECSREAVKKAISDYYQSQLP